MGEPVFSERPFQVVETIVITPDEMPHKGPVAYGAPARMINVAGTGPVGSANNPAYDPTTTTRTDLPNGSVEFSPNEGYAAVVYMQDENGTFEIGAVMAP
jgi:hypothetical protein